MEHEVLESDIVMVSREWEIGLRAKTINDELKVSYRYSWKEFKGGGWKKWLATLGVIGLVAFIIMGMALSEVDPLWDMVRDLGGEWVVWALLFAPLLIIFIVDILISRVKKKPLENAIEGWLMEVAKSMGGTAKYLSMETTLEAEDFLFADETLEYQSIGKVQIVKKTGKWIQKATLVDFYITSKRILLLGIEVPFTFAPKKYTIIAERISDIVKMDYDTKGSVVKRGILSIETKSKKIGPLEGKQSDVEDILQELMDHQEMRLDIRESIRHKIQERIVKVKSGQDLYKITLEAYMSTIGGGRQRFEMEIRKMQEQGLTREQAIQKMAQKLRI